MNSGIKEKGKAILREETGGYTKRRRMKRSLESKGKRT